MPERDNYPEPGHARPRGTPEAKTLSEWRIEQIEIRLDKELTALRAHVDKSISETRKYIDDEIKDIREQNDRRFSKIDKFIYGTFVFVGTPIFGAVVGLFFKGNPLGG